MLKKDQWTMKYLQEWQADFGDEPDAEQSLQFLKDVLSALKELSRTELTSSSTEAVASSVIAMIKSQQNPEESLEYFQAVLFEAAVSSPLDPSDLAEVARLLVQELPGPLNQRFQRQFGLNTRERWNGPDKPSPEKDIDRCIEEWISLNIFVAHLTRVHAVLLEDFALRTLNRAFGPGSNPMDEGDYHVPAAAAWMGILGREIYFWSSSTTEPGDSKHTAFNRTKWDWWKRGFRTVWKSGNLRPQSKQAARMAWHGMRNLENQPS